MNQHKLRKQVFILLSVTIALFCCVLLFELLMFVSVRRKEAQAFVNDTVINMSESAERNYRRLCSLVDYLAMQNDIVSFLSDNDPQMKFFHYGRVISAFKSASILNPSIVDIVLYDDRLSSVYANSDQKAFNIVNRIELESKRIQYDAGYNYLVQVSPVYSQEWSIGNTQIIGYVVAIVSPDVLAFSPMEMRDNVVHLVFTDTYGTEIWKSDSRDYSNQKWKVESVQYMDELGLLLRAEYVPIYHLFSSWSSFVFVLVVVLAIAVAAVIWIIEIKNIVNPINSFNDQIVSIKENPEDYSRYNEPISGYPEIRLLHDSFFDLMTEVSQLNSEVVKMNSEVYEQKILRTQAELQFLRSQINPHFLYNTFETITGLAAEHGETDIMDIMKSLSGIFTYSLRGRTYVPLVYEVRMISDYLRIQKIRFSDKLEVFFDISKETFERKIPKMILQPIVENAIKHGMEETTDICRIRVRSCIIDGGDMVISVLNTGPCIDEDRLHELRSRLSQPVEDMPDVNTESIGLANVNRRLKLNYGNEYSIQVESVDEQTVFTIVVPDKSPRGKDLWTEDTQL